MTQQDIQDSPDIIVKQTLGDLFAEEAVNALVAAN